MEWIDDYYRYVDEPKYKMWSDESHPIFVLIGPSKFYILNIGINEIYDESRKILKYIRSKFEKHRSQSIKRAACRTLHCYGRIEILLGALTFLE